MSANSQSFFANEPLWSWLTLYTETFDRPSIALGSYQSIEEKNREDLPFTYVYTEEKPKYGKHTKDEVQHEWNIHESEFEASVEGQTLHGRLDNELEDTMTWWSPPHRYYVLGLPSLHESDDLKTSIRQLKFAFQIVQKHYNYLLQNVLFETLAVIVDSTHFTQEDSTFVKWVFERGNERRCHVLSFGDIPSDFQQPSDTRNMFIITFKPKNPVRQILYDLFPNSPAVDVEALPRAVICAAKERDNLPINPILWAGDRNSEKVWNWLSSYKATTISDDPSFIETFGDIRFHRPLYLCPETPDYNSPANDRSYFSTGNTPSPPAPGAPSPACNPSGDNGANLAEIEAQHHDHGADDHTRGNVMILNTSSGLKRGVKAATGRTPQDRDRRKCFTVKQFPEKRPTPTPSMK